MTREEFSNEFDVRVASYRRFKDFDDRELLDSIEFNEYEKSLFLTQSQSLLVEECYSGKQGGISFENTEQNRRYLNKLLKQKDYILETESVTDEVSEDTEIEIVPQHQLIRDGKYIHTSYTLPDDCDYLVFEQIFWATESDCTNSMDVDIKPTTHDEFIRVKRNPFRGPTPNRALRIDNGNNDVELITKYKIGTYEIRYLSRPKPIILTDLPDELTIEGYSTAMDCELSPALHQQILDTAVKLAIQHKLGTAPSNNNNQDNKENS